jgi:hypothetical protein
VKRHVLEFKRFGLWVVHPVGAVNGACQLPSSPEILADAAHGHGPTIRPLHRVVGGGGGWRHTVPHTPDGDTARKARCFVPDATRLGCRVRGEHLHVRRRDDPNGATAKSRRSRAVPADWFVVQGYDQYML